MNIIFKDEGLFKNLRDNSLSKFIVGSYLYKTNNEKSDKDYLYIYPVLVNELLNVGYTNNQLQYKIDNEDHLFISVVGFIKNIINGDSTINFELLCSDQFKEHNLFKCLYNIRHVFRTYNLIKSFLGFAHRDYKMYLKEKDTYIKNKKLGHILRGITIAKELLNLDKEFNYNETIELFKFKLKNNTMIHSDLLIEIQRLKTLNTQYLQENKLSRLVQPKDIKIINELVYSKLYLNNACIQQAINLDKDSGKILDLYTSNFGMDIVYD